MLPKSMTYSDEFLSHDGIKSVGYDHRRMHHAAKVCVMGDAHINTLEGFCSLVKRRIDGVHHAVSAKYLESYFSAYGFRWNHREDETPMFLLIL